MCVCNTYVYTSYIPVDIFGKLGVLGRLRFSFSRRGGGGREDIRRQNTYKESEGQGREATACFWARSALNRLLCPPVQVYICPL